MSSDPITTYRDAKARAQGKGGRVLSVRKTAAKRKHGRPGRPRGDARLVREDGGRLKQALEDIGLTPSAAAARCDIPHSHVVDAVNGRRGLGREDLRALARGLGISIDRILGAAPDKQHGPSLRLTALMRGWTPQREASFVGELADFAHAVMDLRLGHLMGLSVKGRDVLKLDWKRADFARYPGLRDSYPALRDAIRSDMASGDFVAWLVAVLTSTTDHAVDQFVLHTVRAEQQRERSRREAAQVFPTSSGRRRHGKKA